MRNFIRKYSGIRLYRSRNDQLRSFKVILSVEGSLGRVVAVEWKEDKRWEPFLWPWRNTVKPVCDSGSEIET